MKIDIYGTKELLIEHGKAVEDVLRRAIKHALAEHKRAGNAVVGWENDRVVFIEPKDIAVDDALSEGRI